MALTGPPRNQKTGSGGSTVFRCQKLTSTFGVDFPQNKTKQKHELFGMASLLRQTPSRGAAGILCGRLAAAARGSALPVAPSFPGAGAGVFPSPLWGALPGAAAGFHATAVASKQVFTGIIISDLMDKSGAWATEGAGRGLGWG